MPKLNWKLSATSGVSVGETSIARKIFVTGGTGYVGGNLIPELLRRGHEVHVLFRAESKNKVPPGCTPIEGNVLDGESFSHQIPPADTFVHLVGVSHPNPRKADLFRKIDLASVKEAVPAAVEADIWHFVYVSVAQPAPVMKEYVRVRAECEEIIRASGMNATILRPWYVLGPGHWWPYLTLPLYKMFEVFPPTAEASRRLGLVKLSQMIAALVDAVENPHQGIRILDVEEIRKF